MPAAHACSLCTRAIEKRGFEMKSANIKDYIDRLIGFSLVVALTSFTGVLYLMGHVTGMINNDDR